jgi:hypothetical protein
MLAPFPREGTYAVPSLLSGTLSWLVVVIIGLAPMLVYWVGRLIRQALRRRARAPLADSPRAEPERGSEGSGVMQLRRNDEADRPQSSR